MVIHVNPRCLQLAEGVAYLHSQNPIVVHRDLKARHDKFLDSICRHAPFCSEPERGPGPELESQTVRLRIN